MAKVWKVPSSVYNKFPLRQPVCHKSEPLYTLYEKVDGRYVRIRLESYPIKAAYKTFGSILYGNLQYSIRKVATSYPQAQGVSHFRAPSYNWLRDSPLRSR